MSLILLAEPIDKDVAPTIGFRNVKFTFDNYDITLFDIGGGKNIRPVWKNYFPEVYGLIYMVDSSTPDRMEEARETFRESLEHPHVSGKPVLLWVLLNSLLIYLSAVFFWIVLLNCEQFQDCFPVSS